MPGKCKRIEIKLFKNNFICLVTFRLEYFFVQTNFRYYLEIEARETTWRPRFLSHNNFTFSRKFLTTESVVFKASDPWKNPNVSLSSFVWVPTSKPPISWKSKKMEGLKKSWPILFCGRLLKRSSHGTCLEACLDQLIMLLRIILFIERLV